MKRDYGDSKEITEMHVKYFRNIIQIAVALYDNT